MERTALLSADGRYRYRLGRRWASGPPVLWVMLNPSTADANEDDQTIRRCISFTKAWGHPALEVVNLYALRSTDPSVLLSDKDPVGPGNDDELAALAGHAALTVAAWGSHAGARSRSDQVAALLGPAYCLGTTADGSPRHPSRVPSATTLTPWVARNVAGGLPEPLARVRALLDRPAPLPVDQLVDALRRALECLGAPAS